MTLLKKALKGDEEAFITLIETHRPSMVRAAKSLLREEEDVADAIQEAVVSAYTKLHTLRKAEYFKTWLLRIVVVSCYDILRKNSKLVYFSDTQDYVRDGYEDDKDNLLDVQESLQKMEEKDRVVLVLYYLEDLSVKDIAFTLGITENAAYLRLSRSREKFKKLYEGKEDNCYGI